MINGFVSAGGSKSNALGTPPGDKLAALQKMVEKDGFDELAHFLLGREYMNVQQWMKAAPSFDEQPS